MQLREKTKIAIKLKNMLIKNNFLKIGCYIILNILASHNPHS